MEPANTFSFKLHSLTYNIDALASKILRTNSDINFSQFLVLLCFVLNPGQSQKFVSNWLQNTEATASHMVNKISRMGYLSVEEDHNDARKKKIYATGEGKKLIKKLYPILERELSKHLSVIPEKHINQMSTNFDAIKQSIINELNKEGKE